MIFVSVGTQFSFPRLVKLIDQWALNSNLKEEILCQEINSYKLEKIKIIKDIEQKKFEGIIERSRLFITHAGMGNIITSQKYKKNTIVMPRRFEFDEHRNNHQVDTCMAFKSILNIAWDENDLLELLEKRNFFSKRKKHNLESLPSFVEKYINQ